MAHSVLRYAPAARYAALPLAGAAGVDATLAYAISLWGVLDPYGRYRMAQENGN